jgi:hypothetical protein
MTPGGALVPSRANALRWVVQTSSPQDPRSRLQAQLGLERPFTIAQWGRRQGLDLGRNTIAEQVIELPRRSAEYSGRERLAVHGSGRAAGIAVASPAGSHATLRWREMDSNHRSLAKSRGSRQLNILQILAGRLSGYPTVGRCGDVRFRALVKGSMAWLLCLAVGQASSLASSCCSTLFLLTRPFGEGPTVRIRFPPAASPLRT